MAHRGYIAKAEPDGSGRYVYLGHNSYPSGAGEILLRHYQEPGKVDALLNLGSITNLAPDPADVSSYHGSHDEEWEDCKPVAFHGGTGAFFLQVYLPNPEWLYCWTPDGWLAAPVQSHDIPKDYIEHITIMEPSAFEDWFDNNQQPEWVRWRAVCRDRQQPKPLLTVIQEYAAEMARREAERLAQAAKGACP